MFYQISFYHKRNDGRLLLHVVYTSCPKIHFIDTTLSDTPPTKTACDAMRGQYVQRQPPEALLKKDVLKKFANLTGKNLCFTPATLLKRDFNTDVFL